MDPSKSFNSNSAGDEEGEEYVDETKDFVIKGKYAFCPTCNLKLYGPKCKGCRKVIMGEAIEAMGGKYHKDQGCFKCGVSR